MAILQVAHITTVVHAFDFQKVSIHAFHCRVKSVLNNINTPLAFLKKGETTACSVENSQRLKTCVL